MDRVAAAQAFLEREGREIDRARFAYHFLGGTQDALTDALTAYQNPDGGFGRGLEVDIAAPDSNPFATDIALSICIEAGVPASHPLVARTVAYLEESQDPDGDWHFTPGVYQHALAPWFQGWTFPSLNPSCTLASRLRRLGVTSPQLFSRVESLFAAKATPADLLGDQYYAVMPYAFYFMDEWEHPQRDLYISGVLWWLIRQDAQGTLPDAAHFFAYAGSPKSYVARNLPPALLRAQLERLQAEQEEDGGWPSPYDPRWRPPTTVDSMITLRRFGRV